MDACRACRGATLELLRDFGPQAVTNRFPTDPDETILVHPLRLAQCGRCGLVQLTEPVVPRLLVSPHDWVSHHEPEGHLDAVAALIAALPSAGPDARIVGVSSMDRSLLERLERVNAGVSAVLDPKDHLGIKHPRGPVELITEALDESKASAIPRARIVVARSILQHAQQTEQFARGLAGLLEPGGWLVVEVPDEQRSMELLDYTMVWEEHTLYFTAQTLRATLESLGFVVERLEVYPYSMQNALVAFARWGGGSARPKPDPAVVAAERERGRSYAHWFPQRTAALREQLQRLKDASTKVALFGAGHFSGAWVNYHGLRAFVDVVLDDHPKKIGRLMAGSHLPIRPSSVLLDDVHGLCLLAVSPESEERVVQRHAAYVERGGRFASLLPASPRAFI